MNRILLLAFAFILFAFSDADSPPVNTVPGSQMMNEDQTLNFSGAFSVSEADAGPADEIRVTLSVTTGNITIANGGSGLTTFTGDGTSNVVMEGTLLNLNAALSDLDYDPPADYNGSATLNMLSDDLGVGNASPLTDSDDVSITVNPVNDEPSFTVSTSTFNIGVTAGLQTVSGFVTDFDPGPSNESSQNVDDYVITSITGGGFFSQDPDVSNSGTLTYRVTDGVSGVGTFDVAVRDDGGTTNGGDDLSPTQTITINATNSKPVVTSSGATPDYIEGFPAVTIDNGINVTDSDDTDLEGAVITITNLQDGSNEVLDASVPGGISKSYASGVLTLSGTASVNDYRDYLRSVTYINNSSNPNETNRTIQFVVNDGTDDSDPENVTLTVEADNTGPTVSLSSTEPSGFVKDSDNVTITAQFTEANLIDESPGPTISISGSSPISNASMTKVDNKEWTYSWNVPSGDEVVNVSISAQDQAGNSNSAATGQTSFTIDNTQPTVSISDNGEPDNLVKNGDVIMFTATFVEANGLSGTPQISVGSVSNANMSGSGLSWTYNWTVSEGADGPVSVTINASDQAGNSATAATGDISYIVDNTAPTANITDNQPNIYVRNADDNVIITAIFTEANGLAGTPQISLSGTSVSNQAMSGSGLSWSYTWDVNEPVGPDLNANISISVSDAAGNPMGTITGISGYIVDNLAPVLTGGSPLTPSDGENNVDLDQDLILQFNEDVIGAGSSDITLDNLSGADETFNSSSVQGSFGSSVTIGHSLLVEQAEYEVTVSSTAFEDRAGNTFAGVTSPNWRFTAFGTPVMTDIPEFACVGDAITIDGDFFEGVNDVIIGGITVSPTLVTEEQITVTVPSNAAFDQTISLVKNSPPNYAMRTGVSSNPQNTGNTTMKIGPSTGQLEIVSNQYVCNDATGSVDESTLRVNITGGSGSYNIRVFDGVSNIDFASYTSGTDFNVNPPSAGNNTYELIYVQDADPVFTSTCSAPNTGTDVIVEEFTRSVVEAGGNSGSLELCLSDLTNGEIDFAQPSIVGTLPSITGSVTSGTWSVAQGPSAGGGSFNNPNLIQPVYTVSLSDAAFEGGIILELTSDDPTGNNPCIASSDQVLITFVSGITANPGPDFTICENTPVADISVTLGGGADGLTWSSTSTDTFDPAVWGFSLSGSPNYTQTSGDATTRYQFSPSEITQGFTILEVVPSSSGGSCGGIPPPVQLRIDLIPNPVTVKGIEPNNICVGEQNTLYSVTTTSPSSTFLWTIDNEGTYPVDNEIIAGQGTNSVVVNWGDHPGVNVITVVETRDSDGCVGDPVTFNVNVNALPTVEITMPGATDNKRFNLNQGLVALEGTPDGGMFSGVGIIQDPSDNYFFDPAVAGLASELDPHIISYSYTENTCTNVVTTEFQVVESDIIDLGTSAELLTQYCRNISRLNITLSPSVLTPGFEPLFSGDGIVEEANQWYYDPSLIDPSITDDVISYGERLIGNPTVTNDLGTQSVFLNPVPNPDPNLPSLIYCSDEEVILVGDVEPGETFEYTIASDPNGILVIEGSTFILKATNEPFDPDDYTEHQYDLEYTVTNSFGCVVTEINTISLFQRPPELFPNDLVECNSPTLDASVSEFLVEGAVVQWYLEPDLSDVPVTAISFQPNIQGDVEQYYVVQEINGCVSVASTVIFGSSLAIDFSHRNVCEGQSTVFTTSTIPSAVDSIVWTIKSSMGDTLDVIPNGSVSQGEEISLVYSFSQPGDKQVCLTAFTSFGCDATTAKEIFILPQISVQGSYFTGFEDAQEGWLSWGVTERTSQWENAIPADPQISSSKVWITNADGPYSQDLSFVYSPCFDLSGLSRPMVQLETYYDFKETDGAVLQYSLNGRFGDWINVGSKETGVNWFNGENLENFLNLAGLDETLSNGTTVKDFLSNTEGVGWTSTSDNQESKHSMNALIGADPTSLENVIFRVLFWGEDENTTSTGIAFDNFRILDRNKVTLLEHFKLEGTVSEDQISSINDAKSENIEFVELQYRLEDPIYNSNRTHVDSRLLFYDVQESSPESVFNGLSPGLFDQVKIDTSSLKLTDAVLSDLRVTSQSNTAITFEVDIQSLNNAEMTGVLNFVVAEKEIRNGDVDGLNVSDDVVLKNVFRTFLPDASGIRVNISPNRQTLSATWLDPRAYNPENMVIIAFIQDLSIGSKGIMQTIIQEFSIEDPKVVTSVEIPESSSILVYPNPADDQMNIVFDNIPYEEVDVSLYGIDGKIYQFGTINPQIGSYALDSRELTSGVYYLRIAEADNVIVEKKVIISH